MGGSPCSGKSTIANYLKEKYNFKYYKIDDYNIDHVNRAKENKHPIMFKYKNMSWNEMWMRDPKYQAKEEILFYKERFEFILKDLIKYGINDKLIVEGAALIPELLNNYNISGNNIIYLIPTKDFQIKHYSKRDYVKDIISDCEKPVKAFNNWMERDYLYGNIINKQAEKYGYKVHIVDGNTSIKETIRIVTDHFKII